MFSLIHMQMSLGVTECCHMEFSEPQLTVLSVLALCMHPVQSNISYDHIKSID